MKRTPTSTYKMSKQTKRILSTMLDPEESSIFKRYMIDAELTPKTQPKAKADQTETKE